jgi:hypothetical protein
MGGAPRVLVRSRLIALSASSRARSSCSPTAVTSLESGRPTMVAGSRSGRMASQHAIQAVRLEEQVPRSRRRTNARKGSNVPRPDVIHARDRRAWDGWGGPYVRRLCLLHLGWTAILDVAMYAAHLAVPDAAFEPYWYVTLAPLGYVALLVLTAPVSAVVGLAIWLLGRAGYGDERVSSLVAIVSGQPSSRCSSWRRARAPSRRGSLSSPTSSPCRPTP